MKSVHRDPPLDVAKKRSRMCRTNAIVEGPPVSVLQYLRRDAKSALSDVRKWTINSLGVMFSSCRARHMEIVLAVSAEMFMLDDAMLNLNNPELMLKLKMIDGHKT
ncbi:hypothetical protein PGT21_021013 [Puccinia graminis f. sp. tritici]|uniref:Uncharacterized protein n=1 Tax=Puccinia graminis f. sp. tritici TaxID=56615 RepID=A0A5B0M1G2_PUCGR|nr:hypothetical protein PGT21_021013 [Puccinia graminis f. sp. tritici]